MSTGHGDCLRSRPRVRLRSAPRGARVQDVHARPQAAAPVADRSGGDPRSDGGDRRLLATGVACARGSRRRRAAVGQRPPRQERFGQKDRRVGCGVARPATRVRPVERQLRPAAGDRATCGPASTMATTFIGSAAVRAETPNTIHTMSAMPTKASAPQATARGADRNRSASSTKSNAYEPRNNRARRTDLVKMATLIGRCPFTVHLMSIRTACDTRFLHRDGWSSSLSH